MAAAAAKPVGEEEVEETVVFTRPPLEVVVMTIVSGALSRTLGQAVIHPLDTMKTRLQVTIPLPALQQWQRLVDGTCTQICGIKVCNWIGAGGFRDAYLGFTGAVAGMLPTALVYFGTDELCKRGFENTLKWDRTKAPARLISSTIAAAASCFFKVPTDVMKHRVQAYVYPDVFNAASTILNTQGIAGLYKGFSATMMRDVPEMVIQFTVYDLLQRYLNKKAEEEAKAKGLSAPAAGGAGQHLTLGGVAGAAAAFFTTPFDVVKTQLQCGGATSVPGAFASIIRDKGVGGLFGGVGPRVLQTTIMSAVFFACFEVAKKEIARMQEAKEAAAKKPSCTIEEYVTPLNAKKTN